MRNAPINRRRFLKLTSATAGAALASRSAWEPFEAFAQGQKTFKGETLRIFTYAGAWGDMFTKHFAPRFKALTGAELSVDLGWWDSIPKLKASPPGQPAFDLIMTDATQGYPAIREGLARSAERFLPRLPKERSDG